MTTTVKRCLERGITPETVILTVEEGEVFRVERDAIMYRRGSVRVVVGLGGRIVTAFRRRPSTHKRTAKKKRQEKRTHFRFSRSTLRRRDRSAEGSGRRKAMDDNYEIVDVWECLAPLSIYERGLVVTAMAAVNGEDAMPRLTDGAAEALGKMFPDEDFSQYVDRGRLQ